jgi:hypothetical protein
VLNLINMVNINKIRIFVIENPDVSYLINLGLFDFYDFGQDIFIGLAVDSTRLRDELDGTWCYSSHLINDFNDINKEHGPILQSVLEYCGIEYDINGILDIMLDEKIDINRKFYLESILYFKSNQKGKKTNTIKLTIKHFDDFIHQFSEDIISHEVLSNNYDFSESTVIIKTYLTEEEVKVRFINFLIK